MNKVDLRRQLQIETRLLHDKIEQSSLLNKITSQTITLDEYRLLIKNFYGFVMPCESFIKKLSCKDVMINREKTLLLEQDLQALGELKYEYSAIPCCTHLPKLSEYEHVLGYLYVMEGATLGGQIITRLLHKQLKITADNGGKFFYGYGDNTKMMWANFCLVLNSITTASQKEEIIFSARSTYSEFCQWLENSAAPVQLDTHNSDYIA